MPQARIENLPKPVADEINPQDGDHDGQAREDAHPWRTIDIVPRVAQHPTPSGKGL